MEREPIASDELVYRRVSVRSGYCNPNSDRPIAWEAFRPNENDTDGLSVWLSKYLSPKEAALRHARPGRCYYALEIDVSDLRNLGIEVIPTPVHGEYGHASLATMTHNAYQADKTKNQIRELAGRIAMELVRKIHGPFDPIAE